MHWLACANPGRSPPHPHPPTLATPATPSSSACPASSPLFAVRSPCHAHLVTSGLRGRLWSQRTPLDPLLLRVSLCGSSSSSGFLSVCVHVRLSVCLSVGRSVSLSHTHTHSLSLCLSRVLSAREGEPLVQGRWDALGERGSRGMWGVEGV
eukprot:2671714-Rhodomonas_salina.3